MLSHRTDAMPIIAHALTGPIPCGIAEQARRRIAERFGPYLDRIDASLSIERHGHTSSVMVACSPRVVHTHDFRWLQEYGRGISDCATRFPL